MSTFDFYRERADEALAASRETGLANVRERCLRAAAAWEEMAQRAARMIRHRDEEAVRRAQRDAAAAPAAAEAPRKGD